MSRKYSYLLIIDNWKKSLAKLLTHWVFIAKSGMDDLKKCIQVKNWKNIGRKSSFKMFDINIWLVVRSYKVTQWRIFWLWIFKSLANNASWCIQRVLIWKRCPNDIYIGLTVLEIGTASAVINFNIEIVYCLEF